VNFDREWPKIRDDILGLIRMDYRLGSVSLSA
jgi:hypothetical protein